jgi:hypothetical protein
VSLEFYYPPGFLGVHIGQKKSCQYPSSCAFWLQRVSLISLFLGHDGSSIDLVFLLMDTSLNGYF